MNGLLDWINDWHPQDFGADGQSGYTKMMSIFFFSYKNFMWQTNLVNNNHLSYIAGRIVACKSLLKDTWTFKTVQNDL